MEDIDKIVSIKLTNGQRHNLLQFLNTAKINDGGKNAINECIAFMDIIKAINNSEDICNTTSE